MKGPTPKQRDVLRYLAAYIEENSWPPTQSELAEVLACSHNNARSYLLALERKGLLTRISGAYRCVRLTDAGRKVIRGKA